MRASTNARYVVAIVCQDPVALAVEAGRGRRREDGVALELHEAEVGLDALDHGVEERGQDAVGRGDAVAEVDAVLVLDARS